MKIFNYTCDTCGITEEKFVKKHDEVVICSKCEKPMTKTLTMPAFILKGVGCYSNGTYSKAKDGPKLDQDLLKLDDVSLNRELGLPDNCGL